MNQHSLSTYNTITAYNIVNDIIKYIWITNSVFLPIELKYLLKCTKKITGNNGSNELSSPI